MTSEPLVVTIERILPGGVGLAHAQGKTIFVSLATKGDVVRTRIDREQGNLLFASIVEILEPAPERIEPPCPYFGQCGGCDFQQMTYAAQINAKAEIIRDCLHRIAQLEVSKVDIVPSPSPWHYRARATWQIDPTEHKIGYYEQGSRTVCDVEECAVLVPELQATLETVRKSLLKIPSELKHLDAVVGDSGVSLAPAFDRFETNELSFQILGETYNYNAEAFFQVNQNILRDLLEFVLNGWSGKSALDLYCGVGLFTLPLARRFDKAIGIESNAVAVRFARRNLQRAGLSNATIVANSVRDWLGSSTEKPASVDFLLLDPPRAGAESAVIKGILALAPARLCYVSCDPATLARDLKKLVAGGFSLEAIRGFDMFPQTHHVETVVHLTRDRFQGL